MNTTELTARAHTGLATADEIDKLIRMARDAERASCVAELMGMAQAIDDHGEGGHAHTLRTHARALAEPCPVLREVMGGVA